MITPRLMSHADTPFSSQPSGRSFGMPAFPILRVHRILSNLIHSARLSYMRFSRCVSRSILHAAPNFSFYSGGHLLSRTVSSEVPSAVWVLTVVFGMGTGVSPIRIAARSFESSITQQRTHQALHRLCRCAFSLNSCFALARTH